MAELRLEDLGRRRRRHARTGEARQARALGLVRLVLLLVALALLCAVAWAAVAKVERFASAPAVVQSRGSALVLSHPDGGRLKAILVAPGDRVAEGMPLMELDNSRLAREAERLAATEAAQLLEVARLEAEVSGDSYAPPAEAAALRPDLARLEQRLLEARRSAGQGRRAAAEEAAARQQRRVEVLSGALDAQTQALAARERQLAAFEELTDGEPQRLALEAAVEEARRELESLKLALEEARGQAAEAERRAGQEREESAAALLAELLRAQREADRIAADRADLDARRGGLRILAPSAGLVQSLAIRDVGASAAPDQPLVTLLPEGAEIEVEARVPSDRVADLHVGQQAHVRLAPHLKSGRAGLQARIVRIGERSETDAATGDSTVPVTLALTEAAGAPLPLLASGLPAEADFRLGERSLLSFVLEPILRTLRSARAE